MGRQHLYDLQMPAEVILALGVMRPVTGFSANLVVSGHQPVNLLKNHCVTLDLQP